MCEIARKIGNVLPKLFASRGICF